MLTVNFMNRSVCGSPRVHSEWNADRCAVTLIVFFFCHLQHVLHNQVHVKGTDVLQTT